MNSRQSKREREREKEALWEAQNSDNNENNNPPRVNGVAYAWEAVALSLSLFGTVCDGVWMMIFLSSVFTRASPTRKATDMVHVMK